MLQGLKGDVDACIYNFFLALRLQVQTPSWVAGGVL